MNSQLVSIVPPAPLDRDFPFNEPHFHEIRQYQENDLKYLSAEPVKALLNVGDVAGNTAVGITEEVGNIAKAGSAAFFGVAGQFTKEIPGGSGLIGVVEKGVSTATDRTERVAGHLIDPTRIVREHIKYSNDIKDNLPGAIAAIDKSIHDFSSEMGNQSKGLYENVSTNGVKIITGLQGCLAEVLDGLCKLDDILTKNDLQGELKIGQDKYLGLNNHIRGLPKNALGEIGDRLPQVIISVRDVKGAFEIICANLKQAKDKINQGVTDPNQIFVEKNYKDVEVAWQAFEMKRKTMTYIPYKY